MAAFQQSIEPVAVPAATLLLPYFEVDYTTTAAHQGAGVGVGAEYDTVFDHRY